MITVCDVQMMGTITISPKTHRSVTVIKGSFRVCESSILGGWAGVALELGVFDFSYCNGWLTIDERTDDETHIHDRERIRANLNEDVYDTVRRGIKYFARGLYGEY